MTYALSAKCFPSSSPALHSDHSQIANALPAQALTMAFAVAEEERDRNAAELKRLQKAAEEEKRALARRLAAAEEEAKVRTYNSQHIYIVLLPLPYPIGVG